MCTLLVSQCFKSLFCIVIKLLNRSLEGNFAEEKQKFVFYFCKNRAAILLNTIHRSDGTIPLKLNQRRRLTYVKRLFWTVW